MTYEQAMEKLTEIFQDAFDDDALQISAQTTAKDIEDWDSLAQITLVSAIEDTFDIQFRMEEVRAMQNVGDMLNKILEKLK